MLRIAYLEPDWQIKGETEETQDNEVDQTDRHRRDRLVWVEWAQVVFTESDCWADRLGYLLIVSTTIRSETGHSSTQHLQQPCLPGVSCCF